MRQILAIFPTNLAFVTSVMLFRNQFGYKLNKMPLNPLENENLDFSNLNFALDLKTKFCWGFIQQLKRHLHPIILFQD